MAAGGWAPIDGPGPDEAAPRPQAPTPRPAPAGWLPGPPGAPPPPPPPPYHVHRPRRWWILAALGGVVVVVLISAAVGALTSDHTHPDGEATTGTTIDSSREARQEARRAFAHARLQLEEAGSFSYSGRVVTEAPSLLRPATQLPEEADVGGEVELPRRVHEIGGSGSRVTHETVVVGPGVWERDSTGPGGRAAADYQLTARSESLTAGAALLPSWLGDTEDRAVLGADADGTRHFRASLTPPGEDTTYEVLLDLDGEDDVARVEITAPDDRPEGRLSIEWDISDIGRPVHVPTPSSASAGVDPGVDAAQLAAVGIDHPVGPTVLPVEWVLADASIETDRVGCSTLQLAYQPVDVVLASDDHLELEVTSDLCASSAPPPWAGPWEVGAFGGWAGENGNPRYQWSEGSVSDGTTTVDFRTSLSLPDTRVVLASLRPFDPAALPSTVVLQTGIVGTHG